jgi:hypothetical protein
MDVIFILDRSIPVPLREHVDGRVVKFTSHDGLVGWDAPANTEAEPIRMLSPLTPQRPRTRRRYLVGVAPGKVLPVIVDK